MAGTREVAALALTVSEVIKDEIPLESDDDELLALFFFSRNRADTCLAYHWIC